MALKRVPDEAIEVRSLYMRMFRSWWQQDHCYPAQLCDGVEALLAEGHAERINGGFRLTEEGVQAWAEMNAELLTQSTTSNKEQATYLRNLLKGKVYSMKGLSKAQWDRLVYIAENGMENVMIPQQMAGHAIKDLKAERLVTGSNGSGGYTLTARGRRLVEEDDLTLDGLNNVAAEKHHLAGTGITLVEAAAAECDGECGACIHKEVLDLICETYPAVDEMRELLIQANEARRKAESIRQNLKLGGG